MLRSDLKADRVRADEAVLSHFTRLSRADRSLQMPKGCGQRLLDLEVKPVPFVESHLFQSIATQSPALYSNFPRPLRRRRDGNFVCQPEDVAEQLSKCTAPRAYEVRIGSGDEKRNLTISEILQRWRMPGTLLGVTDLPVRDGALAEFFDVDFLHPWNLMPLAPPDIRRLEMLTAVISTAGKLTDSHSDDLAVCNHCFVGSKLWLAWETFEGLDAGLEDVERVELRGGRARFNAEIFLSLKSACWFLVRPDETVFLPGKFTHRVYTLENYIGVGSFYVGFANLLHTARRWMTRGSLWDPVAGGPNGQLAEDLLETGLNALTNMSGASLDTRTACGIRAIPAALAQMSKSEAADQELGGTRPVLAQTEAAMRAVNAWH